MLDVVQPQERTFQHKLEEFDPGMIWLDAQNRVSAINQVAGDILGVRPWDVIGTEIEQLHPEKSRGTIRMLLDSSLCPVDSPPPMTMMINIPDRVLLIKVAKMFGSEGVRGTCMVFFDVTELTSRPRDPRDEARLRQLCKLPVYKRSKVVLLDLEEVVRLQADGHYTTAYTHTESYLCNLSLSDLVNRLDPTRFVRVHRSHMINVRFATAFEKIDDQCVVAMDCEDGVRVPISRGNVSRLKEMFGIC